MMGRQGLHELLERFPKARLLVLGDLMLDQFLWGKVNRISPEAPVPVVWVSRESVMPGGAANVANNLRALGAQVSVVGVAGDDGWGRRLREDLDALGIETSGILATERPTTLKTRVIAHHQQVVRVDREHPEPLPARTAGALIKTVERLLPQAQGLIIEDYGKGVVTRELLAAIVPLARARNKLVTVDPKEEHIDLYRGVTALTPNRAEAGAVVHRTLDTDAQLRQAGRELLRRLGCEGVLVTLGEEGMWLFERGGREARIPTVAREVFDVAGAGDTVIAAFTLALASGASMTQAARLANHAAGIVVGKLGVAVVTPQELRQALGATGSTPRRAPRRASRRRPRAPAGRRH